MERLGFRSMANEEDNNDEETTENTGQGLLENIEEIFEGDDEATE